jgi:hypothetical protein
MTQNSQIRSGKKSLNFKEKSAKPVYFQNFSSVSYPGGPYLALDCAGNLSEAD